MENTKYEHLVLNSKCEEGKSFQIVSSMWQIYNIHNYVVTAHSVSSHAILYSRSFGRAKHYHFTYIQVNHYITGHHESLPRHVGVANLGTAA